MVDDNKPVVGLKDKVGPQELTIAAVVVVLLIWYAISQSGDKEPVSTASANQPAPVIAPAAVPTPKHNYVYVDDEGRYGYQPQLSEDDKKAGVAQNSLMMVRYLGEKNGVYQVAMDQSGSTVIASCSAPCQFMTLTQYSYGAVVDKSVMATAGTVGGDMLADAIAGQLKVYHAKKSAGGS